MNPGKTVEAENLLNPSRHHFAKLLHGAVAVLVNAADGRQKSGTTNGRTPTTMSVPYFVYDVLRLKLRGRTRRKNRFPGSTAYWERRYRDGGNSGSGSFGKFGEFKAKILNDFVRSQHVQSVIEFGCGDGNQLLLADYPEYLGVDVSDKAIELCRNKFAGDKSKRFEPLRDYSTATADLALSLDVIYHLIEDEVFEIYMTRLFDSAQRWVIVYSSDFENS